MQLDEWPKSVFYAAEQSPQLVRDTHRLYRAYSEPAFAAWCEAKAAGRPTPPPRDPVHDTMWYLRLALDLLVRIHEVPELASQVEAYAIPTFEISSHVSVLPSGYAIGVTSFVELVGEVAHALPFAYRRSVLGVTVEHDASIAFLDAVVTSYLRVFWRRDVAEDLLSSRVHESQQSPVDPLADATYRDITDLAWVFALCHELVHIELRHFAKPGVLSSPGFLRDLPDELRFEAEADCGSFVMLSNYYRMFHEYTSRGEETLLIRGYREAGVFDHISRSQCLTVLSWDRVTRTLEAYYTVMTIVLMLAERAGERLLAAKLSPIVVRKRIARKYVQWLLEEELSHEFDARLWSEKDVHLQQTHDRYIRHAVGTVLPRVLAQRGA